MNEVVELAGALKNIVNKIESLNDEKGRINEDLKLVFDEAKALRLDIKALRQLIKIRKTPSDEREEMENILEAYKNALGMH